MADLKNDPETAFAKFEKYVREMRALEARSFDEYTERFLRDVRLAEVARGTLPAVSTELLRASLVATVNDVRAQGRTYDNALFTVGIHSNTGEQVIAKAELPDGAYRVLVFVLPLPDADAKKTEG